MNLNIYLSEETLSNIHNRESNVYGIISNPDIIINKYKCIGKIVLFVDIKSKKKLVMNDMVEFNMNKITCSSTKFDSDGRTIHLVKPHWCKKFYQEMQLKVPVPVLLHDYNKDTGDITYKKHVEYKLMSRDQFKKRILLHMFGEYTYRQISACENMAERWWEHKDYYRAHNETVKNYLIEGEDLKELYSKFTNAKKNINASWTKLKIRHFEQDLAAKQVEDYIERFKETKEKKTNILNFEDFKVLANDY